MTQENLQRWSAMNGDKVHRVTYPLTPNSIIVDVGGYFGEWTETLHNKYGCYSYIFEPVNEYYEKIKDKFKDNPKIKVYKLGLSDHTGKAEIHLLEAASSLTRDIYKLAGKREVERTEIVDLIDVKEFFQQEKIKLVDLMKINIEGAEFPLLKRILNTGLHYKIDNLQIQFHDYVTNAVQMRNDIQMQLSQSHVPTYMVDFVWENWKLIFNARSNG